MYSLGGEREKETKLGSEAAPELVAAAETKSLDNVHLPAEESFTTLLHHPFKF